MTRNRNLAYANAMSAALDDGGPKFGWTLLLTITALMAAAGFWARWAMLDEVTTGAGRVISSQQLQVAQSLEGGIVRELAVKEGDLVEKDQVLMRIDDTSFSSKLAPFSTASTRFIQSARVKPGNSAASVNCVMATQSSCIAQTVAKPACNRKPPFGPIRGLSGDPDAIRHLAGNLADRPHCG